MSGDLGPGGRGKEQPRVPQVLTGRTGEWGELVYWEEGPLGTGRRRVNWYAER